MMFIRRWYSGSSSRSRNSIGSTISRYSPVHQCLQLGNPHPILTGPVGGGFGYALWPAKARLQFQMKIGGGNTIDGPTAAIHADSNRFPLLPVH